MQVALDCLFGPLIDERVLRFSPFRSTSAFVACPDSATQIIEPPAISTDEFKEIGDAIYRLPLFALPSRETVFRRAYGALRKICDKETDASRLLFKYWCFPRCSSDEVKVVLKAHKDSWDHDKTLADLKESFDRNV